MTEAFREARRLLQFQHALVGRYRFLSPVPVAPAAPAPAVLTAAPVPLLDRTSPESEAAPDDDPMPDLFGSLPDPSEDPALSPYERIEALIPEDSPLRAMDSVEEIFDWLKGTILVPIDENRINPVLGTGDPHASLMIVGEAPGADEDRQGEPFVGRAGQLLNKILEAVHFAREEVYITNILKSRPPNNRDPLPEEVEAHLPVLFKQIALVQPKVILAVGKSAGNGLLGGTSSLAALRWACTAATRVCTSSGRLSWSTSSSSAACSVPPSWSPCGSARR